MRAGGVVEQLGDSEVEQPHVPFPVDEDIGRFEVAVHDEVAVGVVDGRANFEHQAHDPSRVESPAEIIDRLAIDPLHGQPAGAIGLDAGVDERRDMRMTQTCQDGHLALQAGAWRQGRGEGQDLERHALIEKGFGG